MQALPLRFLKTFHVAARHVSFKTAADELCITASAVSHQMKVLEERLGLALFARGPRSLTLTTAGAYYFEHLDALFSRLELVTEQLRSRFSRLVVRLQVPALFASELLMPRLNGFSAVHADIDLQIATGITPNETHSADADVSVLVGSGHWSDVRVTRLFAQGYVVACSPERLKQARPRTPADLSQEPLIVHNHRPELWERWAALCGIEPLRAKQLIRLDNMSAIVHAAEQSVGIALVPARLSAARFAAGTLVRIFEDELQTGEYYCLVTRPEDDVRDGVRSLIAWMLDEFGLNVAEPA